MATTIQVQTFHTTLMGASSPQQVEDSVTSLDTQMNSFLATLNPLDVLDVQAWIESAGTNNSLIHIYRAVTYRKH